MGTTGEDTRTLPKSMRHKQILDVAAANPDASLSEVADEVQSATPDLVERVLDEHGDPADVDTDGEDVTTTMQTDDYSGQGEEPTQYPAPDELTDKQHETLGAIARRPEAPQRELAEALDVTAATVSNRVNSIDGFEWENRVAFVEEVFDTDATSPEMTETNGTELEDAIEELTDRVAALERRIDENLAEGSPFEGTELTHKVVHACMNAETISEDEELRILQALLE